jgi:tRNA-dihydrouridine synthase A
MMAYTDRHFRYLARLISRHAMLYSEMITTGALLQGNASCFLAYDAGEHPLALQLGGCVPADMARCARLAEEAGYDEVNINIGCPSDRVKAARFGACLMAEPNVVADCVAAMCAAVKIPVTIKTRIGIDSQDSFEALANFIEVMSAAGCRTFVLHARKAWLQGLSPRKNRELPPLRYDVVYLCKRAFPWLEIIINGGVKTLAQARKHLMLVDGVMLGRAVYHDPYLLAEIDRSFYDASNVAPRPGQVLEQYLLYMEAQRAQGVPTGRITPHLMGLFRGLPGARAWRRYLSEGGREGSNNADEIARIARRVIFGGCQARARLMAHNGSLSQTPI